MASPSAPDQPDRESAVVSMPSDAQSGQDGADRPPEISPETTAESLTPAKASELLIQRFGGIRPMANKLEVPFTTVQGWKKRGAIPAARVDALRAAARRHGIKLEDSELSAVARFDDGPSDASQAVPPPAPVPPPTATALPTPAAANPIPISEPEPEAEPVFTRTPTPVEPSLPSPLLPMAGESPMASGAARLSLASAVIALLAAGVAVIEPSSSPSSGPSAATDSRLAALESALLSDSRRQEAQISTVKGQIAAFDGRLSVLERDFPAVQRRVLEEGLRSPVLADLLAATQLRNQLETTGPFVNELAAFRMTAFDDLPLKQALDQIANRGKSGIPTQAWLIGRFSVVSANIIRAAAWNHPGQYVTDFFLDTLSDWAPPLYRLTGAPDGSTPRAITERAQAWMAAGDFSRAVEQLGDLTDKPAETAVAWLSEARARVIADHARELLDKHMTALAEHNLVRP